ncbi:hypothetical protein T265_13844 [Opisthorchis viverrini]|uniref:Uncharacterized protein n=1 Tax=Opisthorchis viverrini TaxID=6198 RepID=A0A074ZJF7_OPIVI|nr:hypothetical protein T265_13844 [Opisthorchis viverrini]KER27121.1 hypothetical protein T265_13844 [Opisthorchis viverrini]
MTLDNACIKHGSPRQLIERCRQCRGCIRLVNKCLYILLTSPPVASCPTARTLAKTLERKLGL